MILARAWELQSGKVDKRFAEALRRGSFVA